MNESIEEAPAEEPQKEQPKTFFQKVAEFFRSIFG